METPVIITGDFNSMPTSGMYELYRTGQLSGQHKELLDEKRADSLTHNFSLNSVYESLKEPLTNYTVNFKG